MKYLLIEPNGTRRLLGTAPSTGFNTLETADGTHIRYEGNASSGSLKYPDGTKVNIVLLNNRLLPTQITDRNGNYIQIAYKYFFPWNQAIDYVRDTLGRNIQFNYDACANLVSITAPALGSGTRTVAQFDYQSRSLSFNFSGLTVENATYGQDLTTLKHVYFPDTQTGYLFNYSDYGMAYSFSSRRQMTIDQFGVISDGVESATTTLNYPTSGATSLSDSPAFTQRTENPGGAYSYSTSTDAVAQTMTFTVTRPDSSQLLLTRSTNASSTANGLLVQSEVKSGSSTLAKSEFAYATDGGGSPQVQSVISYDDAGNARKVDFSYDNKGAVTNQREYGFQENGQWLVRRRTAFNYVSTPSYIAANLWRLVTSVFVYDAQLNTNDGDDLLIAQTNYTYDNYSAMGGMQDYWNANSTPGHLSSYNTTKTVRGNVTGVTEYKEVFGATITRLAKLDVFGNLVKAQVACCNQKSFTFSDTNWYSRPTQLTDGDPIGVYLRSTIVYDFNTSLVTSETDPNNLTTSYSYDAALRLQQTTLPTGATVTATYNDATLSASSSINFIEGGTNRTATSSMVYNGWGQATQSVNNHLGQVNLGYDSMQRLSSVTNPFAQGGQAGPATAYQYDHLSRMTTATLPDNNTVSASYNGTLMTGTDQVSRQGRRQVDGLGRVVKVIEPDATGALTLETTYTYDLLNNLTEINQGGQIRKYKYDALGRMLFEKIPEQSATIDDGTGTLWTCKYTYTDFHAVATKTDARGVVTTYGYDTLNRLTSVSYDLTNAPGVSATPNVTYTYDTTTGSSTTKGLMLSVTVGGSYSESYSYDQFNRVSAVTRTIDGLNYTTSYQYNTANQQTRITYPSGRVVNINHDNRGRLTSLTDQSSANYISGIGYLPSGQVSGWTLGNGVVESFGYNSRLQPSSHSATMGGNTLLNVSYGYNATAGQMGAGTTAGNAGQLVSVSGTISGLTESATYNYDHLRRVTSSNQTTNGASYERRFQYDRWGNRTVFWDKTSAGTQQQTVTLQQSGGAPTNRIQTTYSVTNNVAAASSGATASASSFDSH